LSGLRGLNEYILIKTDVLKKLINGKIYKFIIQPNNFNDHTVGFIFDKELIINNGILI